MAGKHRKRRKAGTRSKGKTLGKHYERNIRLAGLVFAAVLLVVAGIVFQLVTTPQAAPAHPTVAPSFPHLPPSSKGQTYPRRSLPVYTPAQPARSISVPRSFRGGAAH